MKKKAVWICFIVFMASSIASANGKNVTFGIENTPPYAFQEGDDVKGILPDLVHAAYRDSGYGVHLRILPPKRSSKLCELGEIDGVVGVAKGIDLFKGEVFSDELLKIFIHPITLKDSPIPYEKANDLMPYTIGVVAGVGFEKAFPILTFQTVTQTEQNIYKLFAKRIHIFLEDPVIVNYIVKKGDIKNQSAYQILSPPALRVELVIGFSSRSPYYDVKQHAFNQGITLMKQNGQYDTILKKWGIKVGA